MLGGEPAFGVRAQAQAGGVGLADVVDPVDADQRPDPRLEGRRPGGQAAAHAEAEQGDAPGIDLGAGRGPVDDRAHHRLPVGPEHQPVAVAGPRVARPVEGDDGVAALLGGQRPDVVPFLGGAVKAAVHDARGLRAAARRLVEVAVQGRALERDRDRRHRRRHQRGGVGEAADAGLVGGPPARVRVAVPGEELRAAAVGRGAQQPVAGADLVAGGQLAASLGLGALRGRRPLLIPAVVIASGDACRGGDHLADVRAAVGGVAQRPQRLIPELAVVGEQERPHGTGVRSAHCSFLLSFLGSVGLGYGICRHSRAARRGRSAGVAVRRPRRRR